jgi:hypothetical protein
MTDEVGPTFRLVQGGTVRNVLNIDELSMTDENGPPLD